MELLAKSLSRAEKSRTFLDGSTRSVVILETVAIGRGEYRPGWQWSAHAGAQTGKPSAAHIGYVVSGRMTIRTAGGGEVTVGPGEAFEVGPGHDAWVAGDEPCVALDFEPFTLCQCTRNRKCSPEGVRPPRRELPGAESGDRMPRARNWIARPRKGPKRG